MRLSLISVFLLLGIAASPASGWWPEECEAAREMREAVPVDGVGRIEIAARAGSLAVAGVESGTQLEVGAGACASRAELLDEIEWGIERRERVLRVWVELPDTDNRDYARLDLKIRVPAGIDADIVDSSGSLTVERVGALRVRDSSGSIEIEGARGPVIVRDSSGSIDVRDVDGPVQIEDGSGSIDVREVRGSVRLSDSSGSITVRDVGGSVEVERDGSGQISVADIAGDFIVRRDGSGGITHRRVAGTVSLPEGR